MNLEIRNYNFKTDYSNLMKLIESEGEEWKDYLDQKYILNLEKSLTNVAYQGSEICGFVRAISDFGLYLWVVDLLVGKKFRGNNIGKQLLESILIENPGKDVYVMSDNDLYYEAIGYKKEGSIYKLGL